MGIWVDTDFGFDDLWALLLLRHLGITIDGVSLVAGNTPLSQVKRNAQASIKAFGFTWPIYSGSDTPIHRKAETAERILGRHGMQTRGTTLPYHAIIGNELQSRCAIDALASWLKNDNEHCILALGPLTNLARLHQQHPQANARIAKIIWLGGSRGRGNHTPFAEYNAVADPEALAIVAAMGTPLTMIDLELCRTVTFTATDVPAFKGPNQRLLSDLVYGYLDIALQRGRPCMSIYDPLAALAITAQASFVFQSAGLSVITTPCERYGQTCITPGLPSPVQRNEQGQVKIADRIDLTTALDLCMQALVKA
ncbi:hypothetical protein AB833_22915 [Chromatiales bacterium (ex Bugula neritina AB1)]|nr:hypothetical protein AB833_22915 [Chromatiales bacterium (ex Bugula neritina AB1)]